MCSHLEETVELLEDHRAAYRRLVEFAVQLGDPYYALGMRALIG